MVAHSSPPGRAGRSRADEGERAILSLRPESLLPEPETIMPTANRRLAMVMLSLVTAVGAIPAAPTPLQAASGDKRPNLRMVQLRDWHIEWVGGRRLLRFTTIFVNAGPGPFELRGARDTTAQRTMDMDQVVYRWDGTKRRIDTLGISRYAGDGHDHWHVQDVVIYEAWKMNEPDLTRRGAKTGFCFFDTTPWNTSLPYARQASYYQQEWCGMRNTLSNRVGVSVGWGDRYPWNFAYQWIDITGLPGGNYRVRATVDIQNYYDETVETDNCVWSYIRFPAPGSGNTVKVIDHGADCGTDAVTPATTFANGDDWDPARHVAFDSGTYTGYTFNSQGTVLRQLRRQLPEPRSAQASARGTPPGRTGHWIYLAAGKFAGYWVQLGPGITVNP